jgi:hypothetical protein
MTLPWDAESRLLPPLYGAQYLVIRETHVAVVHGLALDLPDVLPQICAVIHYADSARRPWGGVLRGFFPATSALSVTRCPAYTGCFEYTFDLDALLARFATLKPSQIICMLKSLAKNAAAPKVALFSPCCALEQASMTLLPKPRAGEINFHDWHRDIRARMDTTDSDRLSTTQIRQLGSTPDALMGCAVSAARYGQIAAFARHEARWAVLNPAIMQTLQLGLANPPECTHQRTPHLDPKTAYLRIPFEYMDGSRDFPLCGGWWCIPVDSPRLAYAVSRMAEMLIHKATMGIKACFSDADIYTTDPERMELTWMPARPCKSVYGSDVHKRRRLGRALAADVVFDPDSVITPPCIKRLAAPIITGRLPEGQDAHMKHEARWAVAEYAALVGVPWPQLEHRMTAFSRHRPAQEVQSNLKEMQSNYNRAAGGAGNKTHTCHGMYKKHVCPYPTPTRHLCYGCAPGDVDIEDLTPHKVTLHKCTTA